MAKSTKILVATEQLIGGAAKDHVSRSERPVLNAGEELTDEKIKALGYKKADIAELLQRGKLREIEARLAEAGSNDAALAAAEQRAEKAEAALAAAVERAEAAEAQVAELTKQLEDATQPKA